MRHRSLAKLTAPQADPVVPRAAVAAAVDRALRAGVCWVAAPAGYGKTTALADYARRRRRPHVWYRVDEGDRDVASFFHHLARALPRAARGARLPVFGPEYADQARAFARRFFRAWFERVPDGTMLVLDDLQDADTADFREVLSVLLAELPDTLACACLSRTRPPAELDELALRARLTVLEQDVLEFSARDARLLIARRAPGRRGAAVDPDLARGWAAGLVLLAERAAAGRGGEAAEPGVGPQVFTELARHWLEGLEPRDQDALMELSLLPEITSDLARALTGGRGAGALLTRLRERQLLVTGSARGVFRLHDLLRGFLLDRLAADRTPAALARLRQRVAGVLERAGRGDDAVELALSAGAWTLARRLVLARAEALLARGQRATLIRWCAALPARYQEHPWLCYWLGVAHMSDDAAAESWLARAWSLFREEADADGLRLTAACAVLSKTDSWRTHEGLAVWTKRALDLLADGGAGAEGRHDLLVWSGMLRATDFAEDYHTDAPAVGALRARLLARLRQPLACDAAGSRLIASETLVEHAGSLGRADVFEQAVDSVTAELPDAGVSPWIRGMWLVAFGAVSGRYFPYARRGFPHASAEDALRAAVEIGRREGLRAVEFGALYHLQLLLKLRNDLEGFGALVERLAEIADSRYTTQVAVVADCQAALHTLQGRLPEAYRACERFTMAIEAANEPPIERWPHFVTEFQVWLADRRPGEAAAFLRGWIGDFDGGVRRRTQACILAAEALEARWSGATDYPERLRELMDELSAADWPAILVNQPALLADLCGDALERGIAADYCRALVRRRRLAPPEGRPAAWPWPLRVRVLGGFAVERNGVPLDLGGKQATRTLDVLRALAIAKGHACALEDLHEWLWPDADGAQAKAACDQALHRLRRLLDAPDAIVQRGAQLRLAQDQVWVDLDAWEAEVARALQVGVAGAEGLMERAFSRFAGPPFHGTTVAPWALPAVERAAGRFLELAVRLGRRHEARGDHDSARTVYLRALDLFPTSERCHEALIRGRVAQGDAAAALEHYDRCDRVLRAARGEGPSPALAALVAPFRARASRAG